LSKSYASDYLEDVAASLEGDFAKLASIPLNNQRYHEAPGGSSHHHNYVHGLYQHVSEVVDACEDMCGPGIERDVLLTAAIWHDYHKIYEFTQPDEKGKIEKLPYLYTVGHVVGSANELLETSKKFALFTGAAEAMYHCCLAHHGRFEWRSPAEPRTKEAWVLHSADMLSSRGLV
jgi:3'-5' exoribonuclease